MARKLNSNIHSNSMRSKFAFLLIAVAVLFAQSVVRTAYADKKPNYGHVKITTTPGGFPILVDGVPAGVTRDTDPPPVILTPGLHTVEIIFPNEERWTREFNVSAGRIYCIGLAYAPKSISIPQPIPCPYSVNVTAFSSATEGEVITFSAKAGYTGTSALNYTWTVSPASATIVSGAGEPTIMVDTNGLGNQKVTAILVVDDGSGERLCRQTAQASTSIIPLPPPVIKCFDCFPFTVFDDTKARLDNLAIELQNSPSSQGYIIAYSGRASRAGQADRLIKRAKDYLMEQRGIDAGRLTTINGGFRDTDYFEFWVVPQGAEAPRPTPTADSGYGPPDTPVGTRRGRRR